MYAYVLSTQFKFSHRSCPASPYQSSTNHAISVLISIALILLLLTHQTTIARGQDSSSRSTGGLIDGGSSSTGDSSSVSNSSTGSASPTTDSSSSSTGESTPPDPPTTIGTDPLIGFMSYRGNDTTDCGFSISQPCLTLSQLQLQMYYAPQTTGPKLVLIEEPNLAQTYPCENSPSGVQVYMSLTIDTYRVTADGLLEFRNDTALRTIESEIARVQFEHDSLYTDEFLSSNRTRIRPTSISDLPLVRSTPPVIFDCHGLGRALFAYGPVDLRVLNIGFQGGNASATPEAMGGAILAYGGAVLLVNCSFINNTAIAQALGLPTPTGAAFYASSPTLVYVENLYASGNIAELGSVLLVEHYDQSVPLDLSRNRTSFAWIHSSFFEHNIAAQGGAIYFLVDPASAATGPLDSFDPREAFGIIWTISSSVFQNHSQQTGNEEIDLTTPNKVGRTGATIFIFTWSMLSSSLRIDGCSFLENGAPISIPGNSPRVGISGGAVYLQSAGSWIDSIIMLTDSLFERNTAGFGGAIGLQLNAQVGMVIRLDGNIFRDNTASRLFHQSAAGAVQIQLGPRYDFTRMNCSLDTCDILSSLLAAPNQIIFNENNWSGNTAEAGGGAFSLFTTNEYVTPTSLSYHPATYVLPTVQQLVLLNASLQNYLPDTFLISGDIFDNNMALPAQQNQAGVGGALILNIAGDFILPLVYVESFTGAEEIDWQRYIYTMVVTISNVRFRGNTAPCSSCSGGAIFQRNGLVIYQNVSFVNNTAGAFGGAIALDRESSSVQLMDSNFINNRAVLRGQTLHVLGVGSIEARRTNISFDSSSSESSSIPEVIASLVSSASHIEIPLGGNFTLSDGSIMSCPRGFSLVNTTISSFRVSSSEAFLGQLVSSRSITCVPCPANTFSLEFGYAVDDILSPDLSTIECRACPFGGDCSQGEDKIRALQNSWGIVTMDEEAESRVYEEVESLSVTPVTIQHSSMTFFKCPDGFCCPFGSICPYDYCDGFRTGIICTDCLKGYSPVLGSSQCRANSYCDDGRWFWPVVITVAGGFSAYLLFSSKSRVASSTVVSVTSDIVVAPLPWASMLKVIVYFLQQASVLQSASTSSGALSISFTWVTSLLNFRIGQFQTTEGHIKDNDGSASTNTINVSGSSESGAVTNRGICLGTDMSSTSILAINFLLPALVAFWFLLVILVHGVLTFVFPTYRVWIRATIMRSLQPQSSDQQQSANNRNDAIHSKDVEMQVMPSKEEDGKSGESTGNQGGQPLHNGIARSDEDTNGHLDVANKDTPFNNIVSNVVCHRHHSGLSCILSVASIEYLLFTYASFLQTTATLLQCVEINGSLRLFQSTSVECYQPFQIGLIFLFILLSAVPLFLWQLPFLSRICANHATPPINTCPHLLGTVRARYRDGVHTYWESVTLIRRYLFVLFFTFVQEEFVRIFLLLLLILISVFLHLSVNPFAQSRVNHLESVSLFSLAVIAAIQIRAASYSSSRTIETGNISHRSEELNAVQVGFLLLPIITMIGFLVAHFIAIAKRYRSNQFQTRPFVESDEARL